LIGKELAESGCEEIQAAVPQPAEESRGKENEGNISSPRCNNVSKFFPTSGPVLFDEL
jgi:hypothetical protein